MLKTDSTPTVTRVIASEVYAKAGRPDQVFLIPQPFTAKDFEELANGLVFDAAAFVKIANKAVDKGIVAAIKKAIASAEANGAELPSSAEDFYSSFTFATARTPRKKKVVSAFDKLFAKRAREAAKNLLKQFGYADDEVELAAPVTVAKKDEEPGKGQISADTFAENVQALINGTGAWAEDEGDAAFVEYRAGLIKSVQSEFDAIEARNALKLGS